MDDDTIAVGTPPSTPAKKLLTKNVFVDTSVHVAAKFVYSGGGLRRLADLAAGDLALVYHTEVDQGEIQSNIAKLADEAAKGLKRFQREALALKAVPLAKVAALFQPLDADDVKDLMIKEFSEFLSRARSVEVPLGQVDISAIFRRYFERQPPFEEKKKLEFPDAFAIAALAGWCWTNSELMYVISRDKGFRDAAAHIGRGRLLPLESLDGFLDLVVSKQHQALAIAAQQWLKANGTVVARKLSEEFLNAGFYVEDVDGDAEDIDLEDLHGSAPLLVEVDADEAVFSLTCEATFTAVLVFEDPDTGVYDKEDDVMLFTETKRCRVRRTSEFGAELRIRFEQPEGEATDSVALEAEIEDVILNRRRDFPISIEDELVEVFPNDDAVDPDWYIDFLNARDEEESAAEDPADPRPGF